MQRSEMGHAMVQMVERTQTDIINALNQINQKEGVSSSWSREEGGGGTAIIFPHGDILEKGGVNVSTVYGPVFESMLPMLKIKEEKPENLHFFATGISLVLHPYSPFIPTVHANYRYFEIMRDQRLVTWFFGGGSDLTPYYLYEEDAIHFHQTLKSACDTEDPTLYAALKKECDSYFYLPHRKEHRGVGGIFSLRRNEKDPWTLFNWATECAKAFIPSYLPLVEKRSRQPFTAQQKYWQHIRRGRYVEFNLMYDLGTLFGLKSGGNIENILMSLPPHCSWEHQYNPQPGSPEAELLHTLRTPREWITHLTQARGKS